MSTVKAKFKCTSIKEMETYKQVEMMAVSNTSTDNADFAKYTPSGQFSMMIDKTAPAADAFTPGREYIFTIAEVPITGA